MRGASASDLAAYPRLLQAETAAKNNKAFTEAAPDRQPMPSKSTPITMDAVYTAPGYLFAGCSRSRSRFSWKSVGPMT